MADETATTATETEAPKPKAKKKKAAKRKSAKKFAAKLERKFGPLLYPKHSILKSLRIPQAVLENNAGKECT
jgi:hypothetical protein